MCENLYFYFNNDSKINTAWINKSYIRGGSFLKELPNKYCL